MSPRPAQAASDDSLLEAKNFARGICSNYSYFNKGWKKGAIPLYYATGTTNYQKQLLIEATYKWNVTLYSAGARVWFDLKKNPHPSRANHYSFQAAVNRRGRPNNDGASVVYFTPANTIMPRGANIDITSWGGFAAINKDGTQRSWERNQHVTEVDVYINVYRPTKHFEDLGTTMHELGHLLGLQHLGDLGGNATGGSTAYGGSHSLMSYERDEFIMAALWPLANFIAKLAWPQHVFDGRDFQALRRSQTLMDQWGLDALVRPQAHDIASIMCLYLPSNSRAGR